jgi:hypothetical protein
MNDRFFIDLVMNQAELEGMVTLGNAQMRRLYKLVEIGIDAQKRSRVEEPIVPGKPLRRVRPLEAVS